MTTPAAQPHPSVPALLVTTGKRTAQVREIARALRQAGYRVRHAAWAPTLPADLAQASEASAPGAAAPAVMLVDQGSLGAAARAAIAALHAAELDIPVVVLSAFGPGDDVIGCLRAGAVDYINLPPEPGEVSDVLTHALADPLIL